MREGQEDRERRTIGQRKKDKRAKEEGQNMKGGRSRGQRKNDKQYQSNML
jgi:hypothetical protein